MSESWAAPKPEFPWKHNPSTQGVTGPKKNIIKVLNACTSCCETSRTCMYLIGEIS